MQRFVNHPDLIVDDMLKGYVKAHGDTVILSDRNDRVVKRIQAPVEGKVGIVTGGGSGHEPAFLGYVGEGLADAAAIGEVFASPPAQSFFDAIVEADSGQGVACLFGNYAGDNMNVKMAVQLAEDEGITVKYVTATDDIASSPPETREKRHGFAGGLFMWKAGGARAAMGGSLDEVVAAAQKPPTTRAASASDLAPARFRRPALPISPLRKAKWSSGSAITASRGSGCSRWGRRTKSPQK